MPRLHPPSAGDNPAGGFAGEVKEMLATIDNDLTEADFERISDLVYRHCGINLHEGKRDLVRARIFKRLRAVGASTAVQYIRMMESDGTGQEFHRLIDVLSTNLTSFFREDGHFNFLREKFLPTLVKRKQASAPRIRAWSAGCSTGEEAYSLSMTLQDVLGSGWNIKLLATDISHPVLATARAGRYDKNRLASVPAALRSRFFSATGEKDKFKATPELAGIIQFNYLNLMDRWPFTGPFDFIFCRNVMIYFDKETQQRLIQRFWDCLAPGGMLFTGHSESLTGVSHRFSYVQPTIYAKP
jgi:chemotaxis protein methyltransferase CheR